MNPNSLKENCNRAYTEQANSRLHWLDWLRFTAAFMVVACHPRGTNWVEWERLEIASQSKVAWLFFEATGVGLEWVIVSLCSLDSWSVARFWIGQGMKILMHTHTHWTEPRGFGCRFARRFYSARQLGLFLNFLCH